MLISQDIWRILQRRPGYHHEIELEVSATALSQATLNCDAAMYAQPQKFNHSILSTAKMSIVTPAKNAREVKRRCMQCTLAAHIA